MTAPQPATPGSDSVHAQIAEVLRSHQTTRGMRVSMGWTCACGWWSPDQSPVLIVAHQAEQLVPLVDDLRAEAKAEALEEAATYHKQQMGTVGAFNIPLRPGDFAPWLRTRAAAYRINPSSEETHRGR